MHQNGLGHCAFAICAWRPVGLRVGGREEENGPHRRGAARTSYSDLFYVVVFAFVGSRRPDRVFGAVLLLVSPPLPFLVLGQVGTHGSGHSAHVNLVTDCGTCEVGVFLKRLPRIVAGAIQVGHKSADTEKPMQVCGFHR